MNKESRKNFIGFLVFMIILGLVFSEITWLFRGNKEQSRIDLVAFKNQNDIDVVLYGGSTLYAHYSPLDAWKQAGIVSYNYASSGARVDIVKEYIEDSRKTNNALLYVIDIRTFPMVTDSVEDDSLRNWSDSLPVFSSIRWKGITSFLFARNWKDVDVPSYYFDIIKYHSNTSSLSNPNSWSFLNRSGIDNIDKGFSPYSNSVPFETPVKSEERDNLSTQHAKSLYELLDYCDREDLPVLFIVSPYYITESDWKILNTCGDIIQNRGYDYVNFNDYYEDIGLDFNTDLTDVNHLNYLGAIKYTEFLTNYLTSNFDIPDRRNDPNYASWDAEYNAFTESTEKWYNKITTAVANHANAKAIGETLNTIDSFDLWFQRIQNNDYTIIIKKNEPMPISDKNVVFNLFAKQYGINLKKDYYIGVWNNATSLCATSKKESVEIEIGVDGGRGKDHCVISIGDKSQLTIAGIDYDNSNSSMQIIVYDNNYKQIIDNVSIMVDVNEEIVMCR